MIELMFDDDSKPDSRSKEYENLLKNVYEKHHGAGRASFLGP